MADPEQLAILRRGATAWNAWRAAQQPPAIELRGADLRATDLRHADLVDADLSEADLREADLREADLSGAHLHKARLQGARLTDAKLDGTVFRQADLATADLARAVLHGADLSRAVLRGVDLSRADLAGADLSDAFLHETVLIDTDLSAVRGLELCTHGGPSGIDHRTLRRSGNVPLAFLRGVGLPERLIEYLPSLLGEAIQYYACFISYSSEDHSFAERLYNDLQGKGVRCWFAPEDIQAGKKVHEQIDEAIRVFDKLLLVLSEASITSAWVEHEILRARRREVQVGRRMLFPLRLIGYQALRKWERFDADTGKDLAAEVREYFVPDFSNWEQDHVAYRSAFDRLLRDLRTEM